ncbi:MAG: GxxExxY protein [Usitatibacter sp.]
MSGAVIGSAMQVHAALGPGLLESAYEECLCRQLSLDGLPFRRQVEVPVEYAGLQLDCGFRLDLLVAEKLIVELKSVAAVTPVHRAQLLTYLKLSRMPLGLIFNFNVVHLRDGLSRVAN